MTSSKINRFRAWGKTPIIHVDSVLGLLRRVAVGDAASIFRVEVCRLASYCVYIVV
jgi:hypothetical protein